MTFLPVHDFVTSFGHLENIRSLNYTDLSYIDTIHYIILKIKFIIIIKKSFKYWESVNLMIVHTSFLKFQFSFESSNCIIGNRYYQLFSSELQAYLAWIWENVCQITKSNDHSFSVSYFFQVKVMFHEKHKASLAYSQ